MNKIVLSYVGANGHTVVEVDGNVVARDYVLTNSVALLNFIVKEIKATGECKESWNPENLFKLVLGSKFDALNSQAVINTYLFVLEQDITEDYVQRMLQDLISFCMCKFETNFEIIWRLDNAELYS